MTYVHARVLLLHMIEEDAKFNLREKWMLLLVLRNNEKEEKQKQQQQQQQHLK